MRSIRKIANGLAFTILLLFAAVTVALLVSCASSTQIEGANPTSSMQQTINDFATLVVKFPQAWWTVLHATHGAPGFAVPGRSFSW